MSNTITNVTPKLLAQGLMALREHAIFPRTVNRSYDTLATQKGNIINIPIPSAVGARSVTPSVVHDSNVASAPTSVAVTLDQWYESPFEMTDNDLLSTQSGFVPMQASEAVKSLINQIDSHIWGKHIGIFSAVGTAGTTPFASGVTNAASARTNLNVQLAPPVDRRAILDPTAEGALLSAAEILTWEKRGDTGGIIQGEIGFKLGVDWFMDQNVSVYTAGTAWLTGWAVAGTGTIGASTLTVIGTQTVMGSVKIGDIFTLGNFQYAITTAKSTASVTAGTIFLFYPPLKEVIASDAVLTVGYAATQMVVNLMFHRDAFSFASRPLSDIGGHGNAIQSVSDPVSGVSLRLELSRQHKLTTFSYDALWGSALVRKELATKIFG